MFRRFVACALSALSLCAIAAYAARVDASAPLKRIAHKAMAAQTADAPPDHVFADGFEIALGSIGDVQPLPDSTVAAGEPVDIMVYYTATRTIASGEISVKIDGTQIASSCVLQASFVGCHALNPLLSGNHAITVDIASLEKSWSFAAANPAQILTLLPQSGSTLPPASNPTISGTFTDEGADITPQALLLVVDGLDVTAQASIALDTPRTGHFSYSFAQPPAPGNHVTTVLLRSSREGLGAQRSGNFIIDVPSVYSMHILSPESNETVLASEVDVRVQVDSNRSWSNSVTVNGLPARVESFDAKPWVYKVSVPLQAGANTLNVLATFEDGETRTTSTNVTYDTAPIVTITSPNDWAIFGPVANSANGPTPGGATDLTGAVERPISITGTITRAVTSVTINQQQATIDGDGTHFHFDRFFLHEGTNLVSVNATDEHGRVGTANVTVYVDQTAPLLTVEAPGDASVTSQRKIDVRGVVNDAVEGGLNAPEPIVVVSNAANAQHVTAELSDRYYVAMDVSLEVGSNELTILATDAQGNARSKIVHISRVQTGSNRLTLLAGDHQRAPVRSELPRPLTVAAIGKDGNPLTNLPVRFDVVRGAGSISTSQGQVTRTDGANPARNLVVNTDGAGRAQVWLTIGSESSEAGNMLRASNDGIAEDVTFMATGARGAPKYVLVNGAAGSQFAQTNSQPLEALSVAVFDDAFNRSIGTAVQFHITAGDARFTAKSAANAQISSDGHTATVATDKDGLASVRPAFGTTPGIVRVEAVATGTGGVVAGPAVFQVTLLERRDGPTQFSGVVLDHSGKPLSGVHLSIARTTLSVTSDAEGKFLFDDQVPTGKIDLFVDGRDVQVVQNGQTLQYPALHFEAPVVSGQLNQLPHPVYLPPINIAQAKIVGGDQDVTLTLQGLEGFKMIVKAHSVTFPDGTHEGPLVVSPVNGDRLPMVPPGPSGSFGTFAWTLQPTSTRFDPPVEVHMPNTAGLEPGRTLTIVQWDHDLATFVPMGRGTVSEDATEIVTDAGSGITKAGWGGGPPPIPPNCGQNHPPGTSGKPHAGKADEPCDDCMKPATTQPNVCPACVVDILSEGKSCNSNACKACKSGACTQKFDETKPASTTSIEFPTITPTYDRIAKNGFTFAISGIDDQGSHHSTWQSGIQPYCSGDGNWKFVLSGMRIQMEVVINDHSIWQTLTPDIVNRWRPEHNYTVCQLLNSADFDLRLVNSSHYPNDNPYANSAVQMLVNRHIGAFPWGVGGLASNQWNTAEAIIAHENIHVSRYKVLFNRHFSELVQKIEALQTPILDGDTLDAAGMQAIKGRVLQLRHDAEKAFAEAVVQDMTSTGGVHSDPDEFYTAAIEALDPVYSAIYQRMVAECPQ